MRAPDRVLRVGILGTGWVAGARHVPAYKAHPNARLVAVCDRSLARAQRFAREHGIPNATTSLAEFLGQGLDLVSICTPPFAHREQATAALEAGCHVFMEKPMAMTVADAEAIAAASARTERLLCISHNFLFSRSIQRIRRVIESGEAGPIQFVIGFQASSPRRRLPTWYGVLPAGLFFDESPHLLYLIAGLLGDLHVASVNAVSNPPGSEQPVRSVHAVLTSATAPAAMTMTFDAPLSEWHLIIVCRHRVLMADLFRDISIVLGPDGTHGPVDIMKTSALASLQHLAGFAASGTRLVAGRQHWGHQTLIGSVIAAVLYSRPSPVPVEDALKVVRVTDEILRAIG